MKVSMLCWGLLIASCCTSNVVLHRRPEAETGPLGPMLRCAPGDTPCAVDPTYDGAVFNLLSTQFFSLPDCLYGIREILIKDAGSSDALVVVRCAAPTPTPGGLPTTAPGGGTRTEP